MVLVLVLVLVMHVLGVCSQPTFLRPDLVCMFMRSPNSMSGSSAAPCEKESSASALAAFSNTPNA
jgi:hypothetical protein